MKIKCENNPNELTDAIGDKWFSLELDENLTEKEKECEAAIIIDCEDGVKIEITSEYGKAFNFQAANALLILLNQEYEIG